MSYALRHLIIDATLGQIDPSAESRMPENYLAMGIPIEIARKMAQDIFGSFLEQGDIV